MTLSKPPSTRIHLLGSPSGDGVVGDRHGRSVLHVRCPNQANASSNRRLAARGCPGLESSSRSLDAKTGCLRQRRGIGDAHGSILPYSYFEQVVDNLDGAPGFSLYQDPADTLVGMPGTTLPRYLGNSHYHRSYGNIGSYAEFTISGLPVGEYEVLTCYPAIDVTRFGDSPSDL